MEALQVARGRDLDLVEVAPNARPPVCKLMDYGKYLYEQQKRQREARKAQKTVEVKEVRLRPKTGEHDINVKVNRAHQFLTNGDKAKLRVLFRGREVQHKDIARDLLRRIAASLDDVGKIEQEPKMEGKYSMVMLLGPKK